MCIIAKCPSICPTFFLPNRTLKENGKDKKCPSRSNNLRKVVENC
jgi:hypothetical protein